MHASKKETERLRVNVKLLTTHSYLKFWNGMFQMTSKELRILEVLLDSPGKLCSKENRLASSGKLGVTAAVTNTYIKRIKDKKALEKNDKGEYSLSKLLQKHRSVEVRIYGAS